jgi:hypothetical protein
MTGIITPNNVNLAFALEMKKKYSIYTHFDPDDHSVLPMNYECGGEKTSQGFTKVVVPETIYATLSDKPSPEQLVRMIRERTIEMDSVQNIVNENDDGEPGYITIAPSRRGVHPSKVKLAEQMEKAKMRRYIGALAHDFWNRLIQGELDNILSMAG